jgi:hypothetical protein
MVISNFVNPIEQLLDLTWWIPTLERHPGEHEAYYLQVPHLSTEVVSVVERRLSPYSIYLAPSREDITQVSSNIPNYILEKISYR